MFETKVAGLAMTAWFGIVLGACFLFAGPPRTTSDTSVMAVVIGLFSVSLLTFLVGAVGQRYQRRKRPAPPPKVSTPRRPDFEALARDADADMMPTSAATYRLMAQVWDDQEPPPPPDLVDGDGDVWVHVVDCDGSPLYCAKAGESSRDLAARNRRRITHRDSGKTRHNRAYIERRFKIVEELSRETSPTVQAPPKPASDTSPNGVYSVATSFGKVSMTIMDGKVVASSYPQTIQKPTSWTQSEHDTPAGRVTVHSTGEVKKVHIAPKPCGQCAARDRAYEVGRRIERERRDAERNRQALERKRQALERERQLAIESSRVRTTDWWGQAAISTEDYHKIADAMLRVRD